MTPQPPPRWGVVVRMSERAYVLSACIGDMDRLCSEADFLEYWRAQVSPALLERTGGDLLAGWVLLEFSEDEKTAAAEWLVSGEWWPH